MISVIIPTYNESIVISNCLSSLDGQSVKDFEVIVIDDGSTDGTRKVLSELRIINYKLKIMHAVHLGAGAARNLGAKEAKGNMLVFVDADMTFDKNFLKKLTEPIHSGKIKGTFSKEEYVENWDNVWAKCWNINEGWEARRRHKKDYPDHQSVFRAILKSEFDKVNGFTPGGYDDDWSLSKKLGYEAKAASGAIFFHKNPESLIEIFNHSKWVAKRKYKFGYVGYLIALVRSSFPVSIVLGLIYSIRYDLYQFLVFKVVYDFGSFLGILSILFTGKSSK